MPVCSAALADQVVMPYRCEAVGRGINLTPSEPRTYQIYGRRDQDMVTACAPDNPNRCRTWRIHRFDMNCSGARVPWIDVVDAANAATRGPGKVRNGRLYVRMDPWWAKHRIPAWAERPKLREFDDGDLRAGNFSSQNSDYRYQPSGRAPSVEMPPGFAPVVGLNARFVEGPPEPGYDPRNDDGRSGPETGALGDRVPFEDRQNPAPSVASKPPVEKQLTEKPRLLAEPAPKPAPEVKEAAAPSASADKSNTRDPGHTFAPKTAETKPEETKAPDTAPAETKPAEVKPAPATDAPAEKLAANTPAARPVATPPTDPTINSVAPTILNRPGAETTAITLATSSSGDKSGTQVAAAETSLPATLEAPVTPPPLITPPALSLKSWPVIAGGATMILLATAFAFLRRRQGDSAFNPASRNRDLSKVSLDAVRSQALVRTQTPMPDPSLSLDPQAQPPQFAPQPPLQLNEPQPAPTFVAGPIVEPEWLPTTREEALHVLGAGPDASETVIKKIVDGLRMSWHPDHAKSAEDHRMRSERMTQINVAWDILTGRQAENRRQI